MIGVWILCLVVLGLAGAALYRYQTAPDMSGRIVVGGAAMILGVLGIVLAAALVF
jgi:hypothetical protein